MSRSPTPWNEELWPFLRLRGWSPLPARGRDPAGSRSGNGRPPSRCQSDRPPSGRPRSGRPRVAAPPQGGTRQVSPGQVRARDANALPGGRGRVRGRQHHDVSERGVVPQSTVPRSPLALALARPRLRRMGRARSRSLPSSMRSSMSMPGPPPWAASRPGGSPCPAEAERLGPGRTGRGLPTLSSLPARSVLVCLNKTSRHLLGAGRRHPTSRGSFASDRRCPRPVAGGSGAASSPA